MNENLKPIEKLTPFTKMIMTIGTLPSSFYASMSYYESMVWLYEYLKNEVIPTVNNNAEAVEELQTAFTTLQNWIEHYFDNLDLQQEVNTKLDEMATDGTLTNLIKDYVDPIYGAYEIEINGKLDDQDTEISNFKRDVNDAISTQNENITNITNMTSALSYAPTPVSSTDSMTDHSKVYVLTTTGKWYYYDTTLESFQIGGDYQAPVDSDSVTELMNFKNISVLNTYYPTTDSDTTSFDEIDVGHYYDSTGAIVQNNMTSYKFTAKQDMDLYFSRENAQYTAICIYPSGAYPDANYVRYRDVIGGEQSLPMDVGDKITIDKGSLVIVTINNNNLPLNHFTIMTTGLITGYYLNPAVIKNDFTCVLNSGNLNIKGQGIEMNFNNLDFNSQAGLFELQDLSYNGYEIFGTENDYIGPVRVHGESIIGAKHGDETTTSYKILLDGVELQNDGTYSANRIDIIVNSAIDTRFTRISNYSIDKNSMIANSLITTLANLNIDYVFGAGIISCNDNSIIKWLNKTELSADVLIGLNEITNIITKGGNLISKRLYNNSGYGDSRVSFLNYTGRKKLYYYNTYGSDITIPSGTTFASGCELLFK